MDGLKSLAIEILDQPITTLKQGETTMILESQKLSDNDLLVAIKQIFEFRGKIKDAVKPEK